MKLLTALLFTCLFILMNSMFIADAATKNKMVVAVGLQKPPYVIEKQHSGFEIELIRAVLKEMNYSAEFVYIPFGRSWRMLGVAGIDAVMTTTDKVVKDRKKLSDVYIHYQNVAITLKSKKYLSKINQISALKNYSVAAFQNAKKVLGSEFNQATQLMPAYFEIADQKRQLKLLLQNKVEVIIMDKNIFYYFLQELGFKKSNINFEVHTIFPRSAYRMAFNDINKTKQFNRALKKFTHSVYYQNLIAKYKLLL